MQEICTLSFAIEPLSDDEPVPSIVPIVNGIRLTALVEEFERQHLYEPAGGYAGIVPTHFNFGPLTSTFWPRAWLLRLQINDGCWGVNAVRQVAGRWRPTSSRTIESLYGRDSSSPSGPNVTIHPSVPLGLSMTNTGGVSSRWPLRFTPNSSFGSNHRQTSL